MRVIMITKLYNQCKHICHHFSLGPFKWKISHSFLITHKLLCPLWFLAILINCRCLNGPAVQLNVTMMDP